MHNPDTVQGREPFKYELDLNIILSAGTEKIKSEGLSWLLGAMQNRLSNITNS